MRYWCHECKSEINIGEDVASPDEGYCPVCSDWDMDEHPAVLEEIPQYETPEQYEKRTGKKWNGAVFYRCINDDCEEVEFTEWEIGGYIDIDPNDYPFCVGCESILAVCAQSSEPPPDDWKPEEGV